MHSRYLLVILLSVVLGTQACNQPQPQAPEAQAPAPASTPAQPAQSAVERGAYLAGAAGGCDDCHTPKKMTPNGPEPDMSRRLAGHPAGEKLAPIPGPNVMAPDRWMALTNAHLSAWAGPWGISFARNLTPDMATGLGSWTEDMFIKTIRNGKHQGEGRTLLPPMPWPVYKNLTDDDLKALWAFLRSLPAINNAVPDPIPPPQSAAPVPASAK